jgi:NADPH:quinone reductase-like Zn-dependent oxidoreductase
MPTNTAAWINAKKGRLEVGPAASTPPGPHQVVVRNRAVAINPLDWIIQVAGGVAYRWLKYPTVLGSDVAGEVAEVGTAVTRFRVGDRVLAHAVGTDKDSNRPAEGGFQHYTVVQEQLAAPIPDTLRFEDAAVLPLGLSTAACGLFQSDQLGLRHPTVQAEARAETLLVWGGSTSVGSNAIQLAVAAGYEVITTASPRNFDYVKSLGAAEVYDYNSLTVVPDIIAAFETRTLAGAFAIGTSSAESCVEIVGACHGNKFVSLASPAVSFSTLGDDGRSRLELPRLIGRVIASSAALQLRSRRHGIRTRSVFGTTLKANEVGTLIYRDFLPNALARGKYAAAPPPVVVGTGVDDLQRALDIQRAGVSATKVVVTLS